MDVGTLLLQCGLYIPILTSVFKLHMGKISVLVMTSSFLEHYAPNCACFLKNINSSYQKKQANFFTKDDVNKFLDEAPNSGAFLLDKVILLFGIFGGCRSISELLPITFDDIKIIDEAGIWVNFTSPKRRGQPGKMYRFLIPSEFSHFWVQYSKALGSKAKGNIFKSCPSKEREDISRCHWSFIDANLGKNSITKHIQAIARWLDKDDPFSFTSHSLRRTSATLMADSGATSTQLQTHFGWKNQATANTYVEESKSSKIQAANMISSTIASSSIALPPKKQTSVVKRDRTPDVKIIKIENCSNVNIQM